jgi:hypothetical protein
MLTNCMAYVHKAAASSRMPRHGGSSARSRLSLSGGDSGSAVIPTHQGMDSARQTNTQFL